PLSDFRDNYRGTVESSEKADQFDVKIDWSASQNDKTYIRYSRQWYENTPKQAVMPLSFPAASDHPNWSVAANWNRIIGNNIGNGLLVGFTTNQSNGMPVDQLGRGFLNNQLGIGGSQAIPGLAEVRMGNTLSNIGTTGIGSNTHNRIYQIN